MNIKKYAQILSLTSLFAMINALAEPVTYKMAYIGDKDNTAYLGVRQGLEEANRQGQFLNQKYMLDTFNTKQAGNADFSQYLAVFSATDKQAYIKLAEMLPDMPVFNLTLEDDDLRTTCMPNTLHVIPGNKMKRDAEAQIKKKNPDSKAMAQAWHPDFVKYAARDLNKRYLESQGVKMDDEAWAGWAGVKIVTDTIARKQITDPAKLLEFLKTDLVFDGQKGTDMNFRTTGQLRQILLLVENGKIVDEAPVRGIVKPTDLDSLGNVECAK